MTQMRIRRKADLRRGATVVEFALVIPIFFLVIFFFFEAWRFVQFQHAVDQAALEGARAAIIPGATVEQAVEQAEHMLFAAGATTATVQITPDPIDESTEEVTVSVTLPHGDVGLFFDFFTSGYIFNSTITLQHENSRVGRL